MIVSSQHKYHLSRSLWRPQVFKPVFAILVLLCSTIAYAAKMSGYVTHIDTSSTFRIGTTVVVLSASTECVRIPISGLKVTAADSSFSSPGTGYTIYKNKAVKFSCKTDALSVGTLVRVSGQRTPVGYFVAQQLTELSAGKRPSQAHSFREQCQEAPENQASIQVLDPDYARRAPGRIIVSRNKSLSIVPDKDVQSYVRTVGSEVATTLQKNSLGQVCNKVRFSFYVVPYREVVDGSEFVSIDGTLPYNTSDWGASEYRYDVSKSHKHSGNALALTNGMIVVPDKVLTRLHNQAQLASLLSYSVASVMQDGISKVSIIAQSSNRKDILNKFDEILKVEEMVIQQGIDQMYLAGFDIREAPLTWSIADGKDVKNPVMGTYVLGRDLPWYTSFSFDYINQYYRDVDYSKLKRGEAEYQQFLEKLRKADPAAFADSSASRNP